MPARRGDALTKIKEPRARRPGRERESLVGDATRIINRIKSALVRLGIRTFNPTLKTAPTLLNNLRTPEGNPIPPNTLDEIKRDMERRQLICEQIRRIEQERVKRLEQAPDTGPNAGASAGTCHGDRYRDGGYPGPRGADAKSARPAGGGARLRFAEDDIIALVRTI